MLDFVYFYVVAVVCMYINASKVMALPSLLQISVTGDPFHECQIFYVDKKIHAMSVSINLVINSCNIVRE